jgi:hypothetical protein
MITPPKIAKGNETARSRYNGNEMHCMIIRLTPESLELSVQSRDRLMILAIAALLMVGFAGIIVFIFFYIFDFTLSRTVEQQ